MTIKTFAPAGTATATIAATAASASTALDGLSSAVRVVNAGPNIAFIRFTRGASTALATDMPISSGATETFTKGSADTVSAICSATQTATLYFTNGEGL